jgi:hypothetical protein
VLVERRNINLDPWVKIDLCLISLHRLLLEACAFTVYAAEPGFRLAPACV